MEEQRHEPKQNGNLVSNLLTYQLSCVFCFSKESLFIFKLKFLILTKINWLHSETIWNFWWPWTECAMFKMIDFFSNIFEIITGWCWRFVSSSVLLMAFFNKNWSFQFRPLLKSVSFKALLWLMGCHCVEGIVGFV